MKRLRRKTAQGGDALGQFIGKYLPPHAPGSTVLVTGSKVYPGREDRRDFHRSHGAGHVLGVDLYPGSGVDLCADLGGPLEEIEAALERTDGAEENPARTPFGWGFDHIECVSVLEHCERPWAVASNLAQLLNPGGTILISAPWVWRMHAYPNDYWRFTPEGLRLIFNKIALDPLRIASQGRLQDHEQLRSFEMPNGDVTFYRCEILAIGRKPCDWRPSDSHTLSVLD
jgi:SAM-dependent methyltransferase